MSERKTHTRACTHTHAHARVFVKTDVNANRILAGYNLLKINNHLSAHLLTNEADKQSEGSGAQEGANNR